MSFLLAGDALATDRLVLRRWSSDEIARVVGGGRMSHLAEDFPAEGDRVIAGVIAAQRDSTAESGHRVIAERDGGRLVGSISLLWPPGDGALEIGYGVVPSRRGRGYASEATRAMVALALASDGVHTVYADVELTNPASVRVLENAGLLRLSGDATTARYSTAAPGRAQP